MKSKVITDYSRYSDAILLTKVGGIVEKMTGNEYFLMLATDITELGVLYSNYKQAIINAQERQRSAIKVKNNYRKELLLALKILSYKVNGIAFDNSLALISTGLVITTGGESTRDLVPPKSFILEDGKLPGELKVNVSGAKNVISYVFMHTLEDPQLVTTPFWVITNSTSATQIIKGLPINTRVWVKVIVTGSKKQELETSVLSRLVQ